MGNELVNPLAAVVAAARKSLPAGGVIARQQARRQSGGHGVVILADVSGSMAERLENGARKIEVLQAALDRVRASRPEARLVAFAALPTPCVGPLPEPGGGTALDVALSALAEERPGRTLVISDGMPDSETAALAAANALTGVIDTLYVGPDGARDAIAFMRALARCGGGRADVRPLRDGPEAIAGAVVGLLPGPGGRP